MAARSIQHRSVDRGDYHSYWRKSTDFHSSMARALSDRNWNSVGLEGVHCAISATDALLCFVSGVRSAAQDHREAAGLLKAHVRHPDLHENTKRLLSIISLKSLVEYESRNFTESEANGLAKQVTRYYEWVKAQLP